MDSLKFLHLIYILMLAMDIVQGTEKHMICKQVEDVFASSKELGPDSIESRTQGIPGKRGVPGIRGVQGIQGPKGPPGVVDYERVNSTVEEYIRPVIEGLCDLENTTNARLDEMISDLNETLASLPKIIQEQTSKDIEDKFEKMTNAFNKALANLPQKVMDRQGLCEFKSNDKCYWAVCHGEYDINYAQSQQLCQSQGGKVATIPNETTYDAAVEYLRTKISYTQTYAYFWLSMAMNPSTKVITLPDRRQASFPERQWHPTYPSSNAAHTRMYVGVDITASNRNQGLVNYGPDNILNGVLREI